MQLQAKKNFWLFYVGGHLGRDKTYYKISEHFFWKSLWADVDEHVKTCPVCQTTNDAKFVKQGAALHPIPVKPKVGMKIFSTAIATVVYT